MMGRTGKSRLCALTFLLWLCMLAMTGCLTALAATDTSAGGTSAESTAQTQTAKQKKKKGWVTKGNGKVFYLNAKGKKVTGWKQISGNRYYFETAGKKKGRLVTGWRTINGHRYYFMTGGKAGKGLGRMATGWVSLYGKTYYFAGYGVYKGWMATGWQKISNNLYYFSTAESTLGQMATGWQTFGDGKYFFEDAEKVGSGRGRMITGLKEINGKTYYFEESGKTRGRMATGWKTVGNSTYYFTTSGSTAGQAVTGWVTFDKISYYFDEKGVMDASKTVDNSRNDDSTGSAKEKTERRAEAIVAQITTASMTKEQKLWACFEYVMKYPGRRPRTPHYTGDDWPVVYANDMFVDGSGNCFSYAAAFAFLAKACGYTNVYACNSTGHGWTEIDGLVYDPEEYRNTQYKYYGTSYSSLPSYRAIFNWGLSFTHVKI